MPLIGRAGQVIDAAFRATRDPDIGRFQLSRTVTPVFTYDTYQPWPAFLFGSRVAAVAAQFGAAWLHVPVNVCVQQLRMSVGAVTPANGFRFFAVQTAPFCAVVNALGTDASASRIPVNQEENESQCDVFTDALTVADDVSLTTVAQVTTEYTASSASGRTTFNLPPIVGPVIIGANNQVANDGFDFLFSWQERPIRP